MPQIMQSGALGALLADDVLIEEVEDLLRLGQLEGHAGGGLPELLVHDLIAQLYALVADVDTGTGNELLDLLLTLAAEKALMAQRSESYPQLFRLHHDPDGMPIQTVSQNLHLRSDEPSFVASL